MQFPPRAKPTAKTAPPSEPPTPRSRSASRKRSLRGRSQSGKSNRQPCKNFLKGTCTYLVIVWHPPECQFYQSESGCKFGAECSFPRWKVEEQTNQRPKKGDDKSAVAFVKDVRQLGCVFQDTEPPGNFNDFTEDHKSFGNMSTSTIHKSCIASSKHPRKQRSIAEQNSSQKFSSAQSLHREI